MSGSPGPRLDELFVRYWDGALTPAEAAELSGWLTADPAARGWFQVLCAQAVAAAELPAVAPPLPAAGGWSRRRALGLFGGLAAGAAGVAGGWWLWADRAPVRLSAVQGDVRVRAADGRALRAGGAVPAGATVETEGVGVVAVLEYPGGGTVSLLGGSAVTVTGGHELRLHRGTAAADLGAEPVALSTALVRLDDVGGSAVTLGQGQAAAEVAVHRGAVRVADAGGAPLAVVKGGELLTVGADGERRQGRAPAAPAEFAWDLAAPLPAGWGVGRREVGPDGPVVRPVAWPDPYYDHAPMFQIRSDHQWTRGLFALADDSVVHVRYRAREAEPRGQMCFCVRPVRPGAAATGVLEYNGGFEGTGGGWRWLRARAADMLSNKHAPAFAAPRVAFLVIVNTFEADIGLEVAEFRVTRPGAG